MSERHLREAVLKALQPKRKKSRASFHDAGHVSDSTTGNCARCGLTWEQWEDSRMVKECYVRQG